MTMIHSIYKKYTIGIIGGGQLGRMITQQAQKLGFDVVILDPTPDSPAGQIATRQIIGDFYDEVKLNQLVESCDITTYDIEHINVEILKYLHDKGHKIYPSPYLLEIIQDKFRQKKILSEKDIPVPNFKKVDKLTLAELEKFNLPIVQKAVKGGYDGRGVFIIRNTDDLNNVLKVDSYLEEYIPFKKELAIMVARSLNGEIKTYPVVEMEFDSRANICDFIIAPARLNKTIQNEATEIAVECIKALEGVGIFGVELFLTNDEKILVNEIAPRPHNSGHYTIEACITSQFEQHIRAITGLPLGSTEQMIPAVMINLLGEEGYAGEPVIYGFEDVLKIKGATFHYYGKKLTKPFRKMGHVTVLDNCIEQAIIKAKKIKEAIKIKSEKLI